MTAPEFWFYHLESQPLQAVLPVLVEKTLSRGWRACLRFSTPERLETIDSALWTYREESFLPHGTARDGHAESQPVFLTLDGANPNGAHALFLLEAATESDPARFATGLYTHSYFTPEFARDFVHAAESFSPDLRGQDPFPVRLYKG